jgi:SAM-dependent methyltransferase
VTRSLSSTASKQEIYIRRDLKAVARRWDARAASWDEALEDPDCHLNEDDAYGRFAREVRRLIARRKRFCAGHGVIDAGCGTGLVLGEVISGFSWGIGVDISPRMIRLARTKRMPRTKFIVGDCFELPALCPKAGAVLSRGVMLSHYGRRQGAAILRAARGALAPGGFVVFDFLNATGRTRHVHAPENKTWFASDEMEAMARRAGFFAVKILGKPNRRVLLLLAETNPTLINL